MQRKPITEKVIQNLHSLVVSGKKEKSSTYRDGHNIIKDGQTGAIVYLPPEAQDVADLMKALVEWIEEKSELPTPIVAAVAHYQFVTIHPYFDGNGCTARLLTTLILHLGEYDLKGLYSLEEYYAKDLPSYYRALTVGPSHNYYFGREQADITEWIEYFCHGAAKAFEDVVVQMEKARGRDEGDDSAMFRDLDAYQRKILQFFREHGVVTSRQIIEFLGFKHRTGLNLCNKWVEIVFLQIVDASRKSRTYCLAKKYELLVLKSV